MSHKRSWGFVYLWTESTSWPHWWSPHWRSLHSSSFCASSHARTSTSSPTAITHKQALSSTRLLTAESHDIRCLPSGKNLKSDAHLPEDLVVRSGGVHGPSSDARVSRLVKRVVGHDGSSMEVGRQDKIVVLHPFDDRQSLWFNLWENLVENNTNLK